MLRENLQKTLKEAMLAKDMATVSAVRLIIAGQKEKDVTVFFSDNRHRFLQRIRRSLH